MIRKSKSKKPKPFKAVNFFFIDPFLKEDATAIKVSRLKVKPLVVIFETV